MSQAYKTVADLLLDCPHKRLWWVGLALSGVLVLILVTSIAVLLLKGVGVWGVQIPVAWGFAIVNLVWWIGIGHAGTLISAILLLLNQSWRTSINRFAEAMTLFAVACAGLFPLLHLGRPQWFFWLMPIPNRLGLWPQWNSPLVWDFFAIATYGTLSLVFWYLGLIPDLAAIRDHYGNRKYARVAGFFALGWRGCAAHWKRYRTTYTLMACLATPLVVSVHSIVSLDFAVAPVAGWHSTVFPPYFVAGAIFSGFAMVVTLLVPLRTLWGLEEQITLDHLDKMGKLMLTTALLVAYGYLTEHYIAWYSGSHLEMKIFHARMFGVYAPAYWTMLFCNVVAPQVLWKKSVRTSPWMLFVLSIVFNVGMWLERFVIVVSSLKVEPLPPTENIYMPTIWDVSLYLGSFGLFFILMLFFLRLVPIIAISEMAEEEYEDE